MAAGKPVVGIEDPIARSEAADDPQAAREAYEKMTLPLVAALFGGELAQAPESKETVEQSRAAWNASGSKGARGSEPGSRRRVRSGSATCSAEVIEQAGAAAQTLAITDDRGTARNRHSGYSRPGGVPDRAEDVQGALQHQPG